VPELVHLTVVRNEPEAEVLCGLLRSEGIECEHRPTNFGVGTMDGLSGGAREVVVSEDGLEQAQEILAASMRRAE
jgi:Putative prokaryotic signal transducing protein